MNWTQFVMAVAIAYCIYYGLNILWDLLRSGRKPVRMEGMETLVFQEAPEPKIVTPQADPMGQLSQSDNSDAFVSVGSENRALGVMPESSGAVNIRRLFELAKNEMIEFKHDIPY